MGEFEDAQNDAKDEPPRPLSSFQVGLGTSVRREVGGVMSNVPVALSKVYNG